MCFLCSCCSLLHKPTYLSTATMEWRYYITETSAFVLSCIWCCVLRKHCRSHLTGSLNLSTNSTPLGFLARCEPNKNGSLPTFHLYIDDVSLQPLIFIFDYISLQPPWSVLITSQFCIDISIQSFIVVLMIIISTTSHLYIGDSSIQSLNLGLIFYYKLSSLHWWYFNHISLT